MAVEKRFLIGCVLTMCLNSLGCGDDTFEATCPVQGSVTLDQQPLPLGTIVFLTPETGDLQSLPIRDGRYAGQVRPGVRRVEIRAYARESEPRSPIDPPPGNYLPARYNTDSDIIAEVSKDGPNNFDYNLESR